MRLLLVVTPDPELASEQIREGTFGPMMEEILLDLKPEAAYFTEMNGMRTAVLVVHMDSAAEMTRFAEPFFQEMGASVEFHPVMTPDDLRGNPHLVAAGEKVKP